MSLKKRPYKIAGLNVHVVTEKPACNHALKIEKNDEDTCIIVHNSDKGKLPHGWDVYMKFTFCPLCGENLEKNS